MRILRRAAYIATTLSLIVPGTALGAPLYEIFDLGTLGGASSFALDVNNQRQVTGNAQLPASQPSPRLNSFLWSPTTGPMSNLGVLPGSNNFSRGYAINDSGVVVGESDNNNSRAFRWDAVNGMVGLTRLAGDNDRGVAHDINNAGTIVGISGNGVTSRPTMWVNGTASDLGSLDGTTTSFGRAWGINDNGAAVGFTLTAAGGPSKATLWSGGTIVNLGSYSPSSFSEAFAINDDGIAVGAAVNGTTPGGTSIRRATRWEIVEGVPVLTDLGSLGRTFSEAKDINDLGQIVGFATSISGSPQAAWLWDDGVMTDLNTLISADSGWTLLSAEGINDHGDIVGFGIFGGVTRAFLLTEVPEPSSLAIFGVAASLLYPWRRRRRSPLGATHA
jgi:probable HAF family extracellular repeat protein